MFINIVVNMERSKEEYYATNLAEYYLMLYGHKLSQASTPKAKDEKQEYSSFGAIVEQMQGTVFEAGLSAEK